MTPPRYINHSKEPPQSGWNLCSAMSQGKLVSESNVRLEYQLMKIGRKIQLYSLMLKVQKKIYLFYIFKHLLTLLPLVFT